MTTGQYTVTQKSFNTALSTVGKGAVSNPMPMTTKSSNGRPVGYSAMI